MAVCICSKADWPASSLYQCGGWRPCHWNARALHLLECTYAAADADTLYSNVCCHMAILYAIFIFGKVGRAASEEVVLQLIKTKCLPVLLYGLEVCSLTKADQRSLDFAVIRFLMKLFCISNMVIINACLSYFDFRLPSELLLKRYEKYLVKQGLS